VLRNALLLLSSLLLSLALCEGCLRLRGEKILPKPDLYELDRDTGKRMKPGWAGGEFGAPVRINSHGLRSPETTWEKPSGTFRILALGDSWTFGFRMEEENAFPRELERILNDRLRARGANGQIEVINAGVIGYTTAQEAAYFRTRGQRYSPDLVIVAFYPVNDAEDKTSRYARYNRLREIHPRLLDLYLLSDKLHLRLFIKGARRALKRQTAELRLSVAEKLGYEDPGALALAERDWTPSFRPRNAGWVLAQEGIQEIGETARGIEARGLVVLLPDVLDLARYAERYHPRVAPLIREQVSKADLDWLDLLDDFRAFQGREEAIRLTGQRHPSAEGYRLIAELLANVVESRYLPQELR
jgi:lysophospholipase L1-like esterase